jgi:hypothetical protein
MGLASLDDNTHIQFGFEYVLSYDSTGRGHGRKTVPLYIEPNTQFLDHNNKGNSEGSCAGSVNIGTLLNQTSWEGDLKLEYERLH